jgi:hypothetical protein
VFRITTKIRCSMMVDQRCQADEGRITKSSGERQKVRVYVIPRVQKRFFTQFRGTPIPVGDGLLAMAASWLEYFIGGVHIHFCGNGRLWFRFYSGLLGKAPSNQTLLPLTFGASPRLGIPSLRSCSVGPPRSAIHGRTRLTRHPCRVAHCAEPALGLSMGRAPQQHREAS